MFTQTVTITFGNRAENHVGMQMIGDDVKSGYTLSELKRIKKKFEKKGAVCELVYLIDALDTDDLQVPIEEIDCGYVLIIRNAINTMLRDDDYADCMYEEQMSLTPDKKAVMRKRIVNKIARYNLCFANYSQEANLEEGKGTIICYDDVPFLKRVKKKLVKYFGEKAKQLYGEGNYYYNPKKCGIGFHGDSERKIVIALRLGVSMSLNFQWYYRCNPVGDLVKLNINHGDMYVMGSKAVGTDWKRQIIYTLRHAAGCDKYAIPKKKS